MSNHINPPYDEQISSLERPMWLKLVDSHEPE